MSKRGRPKKTASQKTEETKQAKREFKAWIKEHKDELRKGEIFIPIFDPELNDNLDYRRYVSNYGRGLTFTTPGKPVFYDLKTKLYSYDKDTGYSKFPGSGFVQVVVWWSFEYNWICHRTKELTWRPGGMNFRSKKEFIDAWRTKKGNGYSKKYEVHHINKLKTDNVLSNLEGVKKRIHDKIHTNDNFAEAQTEAKANSNDTFQYSDKTTGKEMTATEAK